MLQDRHYMRRPSFRGAWSATVSLLVLNACAFFLQFLLAQRNPLAVIDYLALSTDGLRHGYVWQLLSYQLLHGGILHLLCNSLAIFVFGRDVEEALGRKSFYTLYFTSGIIGGLCQALAGVFLGGRFAAPVVGASAGAFGLTAAFALLFPERLLLFLFFVPIQARYLLLLSAVVAVLGILFPRDNVAHAAHLGGMLAGVVFVRYAIHWHVRWPQFRKTNRQAPRRLVKVHSTKGGWGGQPIPVEEDLGPDEFLSKEVDPILDKISEQGIQSLTERERKILESARSRMKK